MKELLLKRILEDADKTVGSILWVKDMTQLCCTIELPWINNEPFISCIPKGRYLCKKYSSAKYHDVWEVVNVPNKSKILIHIANIVDDVKGCIGPGKIFAKNIKNGKDGVASSGPTMTMLRGKLGDDDFILAIE